MREKEFLTHWYIINIKMGNHCPCLTNAESYNLNSSDKIALPEQNECMSSPTTKNREKQATYHNYLKSSSICHVKLSVDKGKALNFLPRKQATDSQRLRNSQMYPEDDSSNNERQIGMLHINRGISNENLDFDLDRRLTMRSIQKRRKSGKKVPSQKIHNSLIQNLKGPVSTN